MDTDFTTPARAAPQNFENTIYHMIKIKNILTNHSNELPDFCRAFLIELNKYIEKNCAHHWIDDSIDVSCGERSIPIRYCIKCDTTVAPTHASSP